MTANSSFNSNNTTFYICVSSPADSIITIAFMVIRAILTFPVCSLVLYLGHQRWQQQRSFKTTSHSDIFTYHMAVLNLIWGLGCVFYICGMYANHLLIIAVGICACASVFFGEALFHVLTCVERYLAVVHPVTYMGLKNKRGVRIRNISIGCVWLLCFVMTGVIALYLPSMPVTPLNIILVSSLAVVSFCSLSVLCVLIRPGPGEGGGEKQRVDQSKQRAFHTVTAILGVLGLWFAGALVSTGVYNSHLINTNVGCVVASIGNWFNLPSSLVLPVLYLQRAGKLPLC